jgi:RHH-type proline utilization regulon transcriptional repressor/proline dehydrogenase/delta 1-pyrroline-5-carboxylate dehydrogenase
MSSDTSGGAGIKIRLVKGANLANEQVEAETHDWPLATYPTKHDVDASYKRMLESALALGDPQAVRIGVASHNLLEVGWALALRDSRSDGHRIEIEMLEGMAPPQARAVRDAAADAGCDSGDAWGCCWTRRPRDLRRDDVGADC